MTHVFISYSRKDQLIIDTLIQELQNLGLNVWIDRGGIRGGHQWRAEIVNAIRDCDVFLLCMSSGSVASDNVRRELDIASSEGKKIIPLRLEHVQYPPEWQYQLAGVQWIDYEDKHWDARLMNAMGGSGAVPVPAQPSPGKTPGKQENRVPWGWMAIPVLLVLAGLLLYSQRAGQPPPSVATMTLSGAGEGAPAGSDVLRVDAGVGGVCSIAALLPDAVDPVADPVKASDEFQRQYQDGRVASWVKVPAREGVIMVQVSALPGNRSWAKLGNQAQVSISVHKEIPEHVNIIQECGGGGEIREFEPIELGREDISAYSIKVSYSEVDFFTLQPGEFEEFSFSFRCRSPGLYQLKIEIPYEYETEQGLVGLLSHTLLCPQTFTEWSALAGPPMLSMGRYEWNESEYIKVSE
jgi:hypothetical protein